MTKPRAIWNDGYPYAKRTTLATINTELKLARKRYPKNTRAIELMRHFVSQLEKELQIYDVGGGAAVNVFANGIALAVMAIRLCEEGTAEHKYSSFKSPDELLQKETGHDVNGTT